MEARPHRWKQLPIESTNDAFTPKSRLPSANELYKTTCNNDHSHRNTCNSTSRSTLLLTLKDTHLLSSSRTNRRYTLYTYCRDSVTRVSLRVWRSLRARGVAVASVEVGVPLAHPVDWDVRGSALCVKLFNDTIMFNI